MWGFFWELRIHDREKKYFLEGSNSNIAEARFVTHAEWIIGTHLLLVAQEKVALLQIRHRFVYAY